MEAGDKQTLMCKRSGQLEGPGKTGYLVGGDGGNVRYHGLGPEEMEEQFYLQPSSLESCGWR